MYVDKWSGEEFEDLETYLDTGVHYAVGFFDEWVKSGSKVPGQHSVVYICNPWESFHGELLDRFGDIQGSSSGEWDFSYLMVNGPSIRILTNRAIVETFGMDVLMGLYERGSHGFEDLV
jgi:hypothetical protein